MKHSNLYLGLALPSGGCQSLIRRHNVVLLIVNEKNNRDGENNKISKGLERLFWKIASGKLDCLERERDGEREGES
jgi:hypothetical protein